MINTRNPNTVAHEAIVQDAEAQRVQEFQEALGDIEGVRVIDVPMHMETEEPIEDSVKYFLNVGREVAPHMYLHPDHEELATANIAGFTPYITRGKRSAHGVFFGEIVTDEGTVVPVAVKPHDVDSDHSCATDYFTNEAAKKLGHETLDSVGMVVGQGNKAYSMSVLDPTLTTLDSVDWKTVLEREGQTGETMQIWGQVARHAAMLHSHGRTSHGDLAPRNIAQRLDDGGVFFIDWERARLSKMPPRDAETRYEHSRIDMGELLESMARPRRDKFKAGIGLLGEFPDQWDAFKGLVFDEYVQTRLDYASEKDLRDVQDELIELERSLKSHLELVSHQMSQ
jgi:hypothetical protein